MGVVGDQNWRDVNWVIDRLEAAQEGSDSLDRDIAGYLLHAVGFGEVLPYSSSIDAALTLVPEGWRWALGDRDDRTDAPWAQVFRTDPESGEMVLFAEDDCYPDNPALALCIAALRARA
jgi:hypothetical protein